MPTARDSVADALDNRSWKQGGEFQAAVNANVPLPNLARVDDFKAEGKADVLLPGSSAAKFSPYGFGHALADAYHQGHLGLTGEPGIAGQLRVKSEQAFGFIRISRT